MLAERLVPRGRGLIYSVVFGCSGGPVFVIPSPIGSHLSLLVHMI